MHSVSDNSPYSINTPVWSGGVSIIKQIISVSLSNCRVKYYPQVQKLPPSVILSFQHYFTLRVTFLTLRKYCTSIAFKTNHSFLYGIYSAVQAL